MWEGIAAIGLGVAALSQSKKTPTTSTKQTKSAAQRAIDTAIAVGWTGSEKGTIDGLKAGGNVLKKGIESGTLEGVGAAAVSGGVLAFGTAVSETAQAGYKAWMGG